MRKAPGSSGVANTGPGDGDDDVVWNRFASRLLPNFDQYAGLPIEFGRMEPTASDPTVQQQYGMTIGIPNAGQLNALGTINISGERGNSLGDRDRRRPTGRCAGSPAVCEEFRKQPDALERAAEPMRSSRIFGEMPMYCVLLSQGFV